MQLWLLTEGQPESIVQEIEDMVRAYVEKVICWEAEHVFVE